MVDCQHWIININKIKISKNLVAIRESFSWQKSHVQSAFICWAVEFQNENKNSKLTDYETPLREANL